MGDKLEPQRFADLPIWGGEITAKPLGGGLTNTNYLVQDGAEQYVVRLGEDIVEHHVMRFNELAASRAAYEAGLSPEVVYAQKGITVLKYIESRTLTPEDIREPEMLARILPLIRRCHHNIPIHLRGPALIFWVFHVIRDYGATLTAGQSQHRNLIPELVSIGNQLEAAAGPFDMVFGHNDLLAANFLDDGARLWLIDWDYAGFNSPLFDLGGLASNNEMSEVQERWMLETYFEKQVTDEQFKRYHAMKCASLLREAMWSMVSELSSHLDFDYSAYSAENLARFRASHAEFLQT